LGKGEWFLCLWGCYELKGGRRGAWVPGNGGKKKVKGNDPQFPLLVKRPRKERNSVRTTRKAEMEDKGAAELLFSQKTTKNPEWGARAGGEAKHFHRPQLRALNDSPRKKVSRGKKKGGQGGNGSRTSCPFQLNENGEKKGPGGRNFAPAQ